MPSDQSRAYAPKIARKTRKAEKATDSEHYEGRDGHAGGTQTESADGYAFSGPNLGKTLERLSIQMIALSGRARSHTPDTARHEWYADTVVAKWVCARDQRGARGPGVSGRGLTEPHEVTQFFGFDNQKPQNPNIVRTLCVRQRSTAFGSQNRRSEEPKPMGLDQ